jgi:glycosyltransferase involved in cell wall biosynthesis
MPNGKAWPRITIVTPNYNYGAYLEETIRSVLLQGYPNLEYIVLDGGSTDNSVNILKRYEQFLTYWHSKPDKGQASSIMEGLERSTGQWFNWVNSDDRLEPNSLRTLAEIAELDPSSRWITGGRQYMTAQGTIRQDDYALYSEIPWLTHPEILGLRPHNFPQLGTFIETSFLRENKHRFITQLNNVFDVVLYAWLLEIQKPLLTKFTFATMRTHIDQKTNNLTLIQEELKHSHLPKHIIISVLKRILRTRFNPQVEAVLRKSVQWGINPFAREWQAAIYDNRQSQWKIIPAWQVIDYK